MIYGFISKKFFIDIYIIRFDVMSNTIADGLDWCLLTMLYSMQ